jgi:hypothetical protein
MGFTQIELIELIRTTTFFVDDLNPTNIHADVLYRELRISYKEGCMSKMSCPSNYTFVSSSCFFFY